MHEENLIEYMRDVRNSLVPPMKELVSKWKGKISVEAMDTIIDESHPFSVELIAISEEFESLARELFFQ